MSVHFTLNHLKTGVMVLLSLATNLMPLSANAQTQAAEPDLKAAIIANMMLFVEWPANAPIDQLTICFLDNSPVALALARLDGKLLKGKPLKVVRISANTASSCHLLYVSPNNISTLTTLLSTLRSLPVLLAGDSPEYFKRGIMLNLELVSGRVVFDIDLHAAQNAELQFSSKALRLARRVIE